MSHFSFGGQQCKTVCPKCRGTTLHLSESWAGNGIWFTVDKGVMPEDADDHYQGGPICVHAVCASCHHEWKVRGVTSVSEMVVEQVRFHTEGADHENTTSTP